MGNSLYVDFNGLEQNLNELEKWKEEFDDLNSRIKLKVEDFNNVWRGEDYEAMRNSISNELNKISGPDGLIQNFVNESINDLNNKIGRYADIQKNNANYWEKL